MLALFVGKNSVRRMMWWYAQIAERLIIGIVISRLVIACIKISMAQTLYGNVRMSTRNTQTMGKMGKKPSCVRVARPETIQTHCFVINAGNLLRRAASKAIRSPVRKGDHNREGFRVVSPAGCRLCLTQWGAWRPANR